MITNMLTLYYYEKSCSYAPHILLFETGSKFAAIRIDLEKGEHLESNFLSVNPKGRVPALLTPDGVLTENPAILLYIAQSFPEKKLAPTIPFELAKAQAFNMYIASTVHVGHAHKHRGSRWANSDVAIENMTKMVSKNMFKYAEVIEKHYFIGPWVLGQQYSICDTYLALVTRWLPSDGVSLEHFPKLKAHDELMRNRSSVQKTLPHYK